MNSRRPAQPASVILGAVILALITLPAASEEASGAVVEDTKGRWQLRLAALTMDSAASSVQVVSGEGISISTDVGGGLGVDVEYRLSKRLGLDFGVLAASPSIGSHVDIGWHGVNVGTGITVAPITAGLNIHLTPDSKVDLYAGPLIAYVVYESFDFSIGKSIGESFTTKNDFGYGVNLGIDIFLGSGGHWALVGNFKYIESTLEATPTDGDTGVTEFDPTIFGLGFAYRF
jgi:outer membrane protein W